MNKIEQDNRKRLIKLIDSITRSSEIEEWESLGMFAVGGLFSVGFSKRENMLLVESSTGRGLFDCHTGVKIAKGYDEDYIKPNHDIIFCHQFSSIYQEKTIPS